MPTLLETAAELNKTLTTGWSGTTEIAIENVPFKEIQGQSYLDTIFLPYTTTNVTIGQCKRKRTIGALSITIRTPLEKGIGLAYTYASTISDIMDNKSLLPDLFTFTSDVRRVGDTGDGWFKLICDINFTSDET